MSTTDQSAGLFRRLGALIYDGLLLIAVLMLVTALFLPFTDGEAVTSHSSGWLQPLYQLTLLLATVLYFGFFWTRSGQTLGMRAWGLHVRRENGDPLRWRDVITRLFLSVISWLPIGLGYWWMLIDKQKLTWHEKLSHTRTARL